MRKTDANNQKNGGVMTRGGEWRPFSPQNGLRRNSGAAVDDTAPTTTTSIQAPRSCKPSFHHHHHLHFDQQPKSCQQLIAGNQSIMDKISVLSFLNQKRATKNNGVQQLLQDEARMTTTTSSRPAEADVHQMHNKYWTNHRNTEANHNRLASNNEVT